MSLYYDAASILTETKRRGSLKSRIYAKDASLKTKPAHVYALISETAKYDVFLKEVIENAGILTHEPRLSPILALLLIHDHFFAKGGIAAGSSHPLRLSIERHKARLQSELTKARLRRRIPSIELLKEALLKEKGVSGRAHPRWARVNTIRSTLEGQVKKSFSGYQTVESIGEVSAAGKGVKVLYHDKHVPNLLAFPPDMDLTKHQAYLDGEIILQDKASCFPAHLLIGDDSRDNAINGAMDGCAAPGNKTTHLAALMRDFKKGIFACERDAARSKTLQTMVNKAGAQRSVTVLQKQDFLAIDPEDERFRDVTHLLLDPSCSGSGILGREDVPKLALPRDPRMNSVNHQNGMNSKKRKRRDTEQTSTRGPVEDDAAAEEISDDAELEQAPIEATKDRLGKLSNLQSLIVEHAFSFPAARRVTYSTCSVHVEENEAVVARVLRSAIGKRQGWRVLPRDKQVHGMRIWKHRGIEGEHGLNVDQREACIRCTPEDGEGTMGFFVVAFMRDGKDREDDLERTELNSQDGVDEQNSEDDGGNEWEGFSDE